MILTETQVSAFLFQSGSRVSGCRRRPRSPVRPGSLSSMWAERQQRCPPSISGFASPGPAALHTWISCSELQPSQSGLEMLWASNRLTHFICALCLLCREFSGFHCVLQDFQVRVKTDVLVLRHWPPWALSEVPVWSCVLLLGLKEGLACLTLLPMPCPTELHCLLASFFRDH